MMFQKICAIGTVIAWVYLEKSSNSRRISQLANECKDKSHLLGILV